MAIRKSEILNNVKTEIHTGLHDSWLKRESKTIMQTVSLDKSTARGAGAERARKREVLTKKAQEQFQELWNTNLATVFSDQIELIYHELSQKITERHPWLADEKPSSANFTLLEEFLLQGIKSFMLSNLQNVPRRVQKWQDINIDENTQFEWSTIEDEETQIQLANQIQGYPLSNTAVYNSRNFPSFNTEPFTKAPTRCDIYRLLNNTASNKTSAKPLANGRICNKIAPLLHTELGLLSDLEWAHLDSIIINFGSEYDPKWVLYDKSTEPATIYAPEFRAADINNLKITYPRLEGAQENITKLEGGEYYEQEVDWCSVLFSRILPWTQLNATPITTLNSFRNKGPIPLLLQNLIESSCSTHQRSITQSTIQAFNKRAPLSSFTEQELYLSSEEPLCLFNDIPLTPASSILFAIDSKQITIDTTISTLKVTSEDMLYVKEALKLTYYLGINNLTFNVPLTEELKDWVSYNLDIQSVNSTNPNTCAYIYACAARNRFLQSYQPNYLNDAPDKFAARRQAWEATGRFIFEYLKTSSTNETQLQNIAQMGKEGLDNLFNHLNRIEETANLDCTLDLDSANSCPVPDYIQHLKTKIQTYNKKPLFTKLSLRLPNDLTADTATNICELIKTLQNKITEVNFENPERIDSTFLRALTEYARIHKIHLQIKIPSWDSAPREQQAQGQLKARYRALQNQILDNIREKRMPELQENIKTIAEPPYIESKLKMQGEPPVTQVWGNDKFQLASTVSGIQQQAQQEVAQEVQQEAEQQKEPPAPVKREIVPLPNDGRALIGRTNLSEFTTNEEAFSAWVGSNKDGPFIIKLIDEKALEQLKKYPNLFKFGIDSERTPGFRLYYASDTDKSLVLTFDENLVEQDIVALKSDPFAVRMNDCKPAKPFVGDFCQLHRFTEDPQELLTLWKFMAVEEELSPPIQQWLSENSPGTTTESLQLYNFNKTNLTAKDAVAFQNIIKRWSGIHNEEFFNALFKNFTPKNMQAFGQLFYHYDVAGNGNFLELSRQVFETFCKENSDRFDIFKQYLIDPLSNWSECLAPREVKALTTSMAKLDGHLQHQDVLWKLVEAHGQAIDGRMRFSEVWEAYDKVITYINNHDLNINFDQFNEAIENYSVDFNATQFLRRIYEVLQATGNRQDSEAIQNEILQNLSQINWKENGFYYACIHEHFRYWAPELSFEDLDHLDGTENPSYTANWDEITYENITNPTSYTLRYAAQNLKLNREQFARFSKIIQIIAKRCPNNQLPLMRLATATLALGIDDIESLALVIDNTERLEEMNWSILSEIDESDLIEINQHIQLDTPELIKRSLHCTMKDLPILIVIAKEVTLNLDGINAFGRAMQAIDPNSDTFNDLINYAKQCGSNSRLVTYYPWLVSAPKNILSKLDAIEQTPDVERFLQQLTSIDFSNSTLPVNNDLLEQLQTINSPETRRQAIKSLIKGGCNILDQDADFIPLPNDKKQMFDELFLAKTFAKQNHNLLEELFKHLAIKQEGNDNEKIEKLLNLFAELGRKSYFDELGKLLGLLLEKSQGNQYYSIEQLTTWLETVFDETTLQSKLYPVKFIEQLLDDALQDPESSLIKRDLTELKTSDERLETLKRLMRKINLEDYSYAAKKTLTQTAIQFKYAVELENIVLQLEEIFKTLKASPGVNSSLCEYINSQLATDKKANLVENLDMLTTLAKACTLDNEPLQKLWESSQAKLLECLKKETITTNIIHTLVNIGDDATRLILTEAINAGDDLASVEDLIIKVGRLSRANKIKIAEYYLSDPKPSINQLSALIITYGARVDEAIDHFERKVLPEGKRYYSLEEKDRTNIFRVIDGIRLKTPRGPQAIKHNEKSKLLNVFYYTNNYARANRLEDKSYEELLATIQENKGLDNTPEAKARVLACIREVIVRKTGKWINHTQMIDLIYSIVHDEDNLLHQIRMGEGKSIISLARVAYRALNGRVVDVFSSKNSLSSRDHIESAPVLDALGIRHSHITPGSNPEQYHNSLDASGVGAAHYSTIGSWSLFILGNCWKNKDGSYVIDLDADFRDAFLDEGDHLMRVEDTLFNFSDQTGEAAIFNYDAWAYKITYDYFMANFSEFEANNFEIKEDPHLRNLFELLQEGSQKIAPDKSTIFKEYLATNDRNVRNTKLIGLLTAARLAQTLQEGGDFCVMNEAKDISDSSSIDTRIAKVMINSQVYHGSTYSDLVHQFLHTGLNSKAVEQFQIPNFFIEPESEIVLSLVAEFVLKHYYRHLEACTGTPGDHDALKFYIDEFGVFRVVKLPTHEENKTKFLEPIYCEEGNEVDGITAEIEQIVTEIKNNPDEPPLDKCPGLTAQVAAIVKSIRENSDQPILVTCEDDREVETLGRLIAAALRNRPPAVVIDTNASGLTEAEILKNAGHAGSVTVSARLGRGSDIKPDDKEVGLRVIRTYPADPEVVKQEQGRQGRHGAKGVCQDILNYTKIKSELNAYQEKYPDEFAKIHAEQVEHLTKKLTKRSNNDNENKQIWTKIRASEDLKEKYLNTRTLQKLKQTLKQQAKILLKQKNSLIAESSALAAKKVQSIVDPEQHQIFENEWRTCRKEIEEAWAETGNDEKSREILSQFCLKWDIELFNPIEREMSFKAEDTALEEESVESLPTFEQQIEFHQAWLAGICEGFEPTDELYREIFGENSQDLETLFLKFAELNAEQLTRLQEIVGKFPLCHYVTCETWGETIDLILEGGDISENFDLRANIFFDKYTSAPSSIVELASFNKLFKTTIEGVPDKDFIINLIEENFDDEDSQQFLIDLVENQFHRKVVELCKIPYMNNADIIHLLKTLNKSPETATNVLNCLESQSNNLKLHFTAIRPLISVIAYTEEENINFNSMPISDETPALMSVLSGRPIFSLADYQAIQMKLNDIPDPNNRIDFMRLLTNIPPHISISSILKDFDDLPGLASFTPSGEAELRRRFECIQHCAKTFNSFLFKMRIIEDKTKYTPPLNIDTYKHWQDIYWKLTIDKRDELFTHLTRMDNGNMRRITEIADSYARDPLILDTLSEREDVNQIPPSNTSREKSQSNSQPDPSSQFLSNKSWGSLWKRNEHQNQEPNITGAHRKHIR